MKLKLTVLSAVLATSSALAESPLPVIPAIPAIPAVPVQVAKNDLPPHPAATKQAAPAMAQASNAVPQTTDMKSTLVVEPGVNEIVQVAVHHLNRIVTPFESPRVTTSSPATTEIRDNVIYIGTASETPVTVFITEAGSEEKAISLTMIPRKVPPRQLTLKLNKSVDGNNIMVSKKAERWEKSQPYMMTIESVFKTIALGDLPPGYEFQNQAEGHLPLCQQAGIEYQFANGQTISGHNLIVHIGVARNVGTQPIEIREMQCGAWNIAAVAAFPTNVLAPGQATEMYVATKRHFVEEVKVARPSLIRGN